MKRRRQPTRDEVERYTQGMCAFYALALHERTGWPIVALVDRDAGQNQGETKHAFINRAAEHFVVLAPGGVLVDVEGEFGGGHPRWRDHAEVDVTAAMVRRIYSQDSADDFRVGMDEARRDLDRLVDAG